MTGYGYGGYGYYPPTAPRPKAARGKERKKFGLTWWGRKWVESIESMDDSQRMSRARAYARGDKVYNIRIGAGKVTANVEGNYGNYDVAVSFERLDDRKADAMLSRIRDSDALGAVLNNELPENIEGICGVDPIPRISKSSCSCPDDSNPCKHVGALYYVMADEIDAAPQILFVLNGVKKERLIQALIGAAARGNSGSRKIKAGSRDSAPGKKGKAAIIPPHQRKRAGKKRRRRAE